LRPTALLITLSGGEPDNYDGYRGNSGIEDTHQALIKAKRNGIHPFFLCNRHRGVRLPVTHVRRGELGAGEWRKVTATQSLGYLPAVEGVSIPDQEKTIKQNPTQ